MKTQCPITSIIKRNGTIVKYNRARISAAILKAAKAMGKPDPSMAERMTDRVEAALIDTYGTESTPTVEDVQDVVENVLMENHHTDIARDYIIYRHQRSMARSARAFEFEVTDNVPYKKLYQVLLWNMDHGCDSVSSLNKLILRGRFPDLVVEAERRYKQEVELAASAVLSDLDNIRIVIVAGPSSSGKTTTTKKMAERLRAARIRFKTLNVDNYFFDLECHPKDEFGDYDYETPRALDMELIDRHLVQLIEGRKVKIPRYDFKSGIRHMDKDEFVLGKQDVLLIDSLHGLYEDMTRSIPAKKKFRLYIETLGQFKTDDGTLMRWADNRLLRRMIRDRDHRNSTPMQTLTHWHYVRRSELTHIIPFIKTCDCLVNSALPYELPILKHRLFRYISASTRRHKDDPKRLDAHIRANRVYDLLKPLKPMRDDSCVPQDSLLREFIGGSKYKY